MRKIKVLNLELIEREGWVKVRGTLWVEGKGAKGFERPILYIGKEVK